MGTLDQRLLLVDFLKSFREEVIREFEALELPDHGKTFERKAWSHPSGGGGEMAVLRGDMFEKAAVNWSGVSGEQFPTAEAKGAFFATGVSLITHMKNPHAPTVHMNIRYIETADRFWFGGGYDLTPMGIPYAEDVEHFHGVAQKALEPFGDQVYREFSENAKKYFFIPHWKKERGAGGIFFDHWNTGNFEADCALWKQVGNTFLDAILPIYRKRVNLPYSETQKAQQLRARGQYVEFNLLYDRGTQFGFRSGGHPEAILCSMPPLAAW